MTSIFKHSINIQTNQDGKVCPWLFNDLECFFDMFQQYVKTMKLPNELSRRDVVRSARSSRIKFFAKRHSKDGKIKIFRVDPNYGGVILLHRIDLSSNNEFVLTSMVNAMNGLISESIRDSAPHLSEKYVHEPQGTNIVYRKIICVVTKEDDLPFFIKNQNEHLFKNIAHHENNIDVGLCCIRRGVVVQGTDTCAVLRTVLRIKEYIQEATKQQEEYKKTRKNIATTKTIKTKTVTSTDSKQEPSFIDANNTYTILRNHGYGKYLRV